jgi:signal transduction histidine kinase
MSVLTVLFSIETNVLNAQPSDKIQQLLNRLDSSSSMLEQIDIYNDLSAAYIKVDIDTFFLYHLKASNLAQSKNYQRGIAEAMLNRSEMCFYKDSFKQALKYFQNSKNKFTHLKDTSKLIHLNYSLGKTYYFLANYDSAQVFFQKAYDLAEIAGDTSNMAKSIKQVGKMQWVKGELAESLKSYEISLPLAKSVHDTALICVLYNNIGIIYFGVGDYGKALEYYYLALPLRDSLNDYKGKSLTLNNIGMVFSEWGKHDEAYKYYRHAASLSDSVYYLGGKAYSYYNLGNHYFNLNNLDSAIVNFKRSLDTYLLDNNDIIGMYICYAKIGNVYHMRNELDSALSAFNKALNTANRMKGRNDRAGANYNLGNLYLSKGDINKALEYALKSNEILKETDFKKMKHLNYQLLSEIFRRKKNYKKALEYNILSNQYKDSIFNEEKTKQITRMEILYRIEQKNKENEFLKREQERQKAKLEADRMTIRLQNILFGVIVLVLILVIGFTYVFYKEKLKLKEANNTKNKLFSIISHDLRGPLGNFKGLIDLLLLDFANDDREKMNSLLKMMQKTAGLNYDLLENLLSWSRAESQKLDFQPEKINLYTIVNSIFEHYDYSALTKSIKLINKVDEQLCIYADEYMINTILRNLISNAIKFTNTDGKIIVSAKTKDNFIEITVVDNGIGMSPEITEKIFDNENFFTTRGTAKEKGTGLGLKLCKDFVKIHQGEIFAKSQLNKGTKISFTISKCDD